MRGTSRREGRAPHRGHGAVGPQPVPTVVKVRLYAAITVVAAASAFVLVGAAPFHDKELRDRGRWTRWEYGLLSFRQVSGDVGGPREILHTGKSYAELARMHGRSKPGFVHWSKWDTGRVGDVRDLGRAAAGTLILSVLLALGSSVLVGRSVTTARVALFVAAAAPLVLLVMFGLKLPPVPDPYDFLITDTGSEGVAPSPQLWVAGGLFFVGTLLVLWRVPREVRVDRRRRRAGAHGGASAEPDGGHVGR